MSNINQSITLASLNCRGLNKLLNNRGRPFGRIIQNFNFDILALQETNTTSPTIQQLIHNRS